VEVMGVRKINREDRFSYDDYKEWEDSEDWEIIGGKPYMMAPSPNTNHQRIGKKFISKIGNFLDGKPCELFYELDVILSKEDIVKPDIMVVCDKNKITDKNIKGAPDLIIEILSPSTAKKDKLEKYNLYKKSGVREYWIVDQYNLLIDVHNFEKGEVNSYFYDEKMEENFVEVGIFGTELKLDVNYIFKE
jgi:Uma2 family endonuclease